MKQPLLTVCSLSYFLLMVLFVLASAVSGAQIPNHGFESWTASGNALNPDGWWSSNDSVSSSGSYFPITRSADHYPEGAGSYSIRIANNTALLPAWGAMGIAWTGAWEGNDAPAFPLEGHPVSLCGYYKFAPENGDVFRIFIALYQNGTEVTQAEWMNTEDTGGWASFVLPFPEYTEADSARIMLSAFDADNFEVQGNSVLYVDNLSFDQLITATPESAERADGMAVYPNPARDVVCVKTVTPPARGAVLQVFDAAGRCVVTRPCTTGLTVLPLEGWAAGTYVVTVQTGDRVMRQVLQVNR